MSWVVIPRAVEERLQSQTQVGVWQSYSPFRVRDLPSGLCLVPHLEGQEGGWGWLLVAPFWAAWPSASTLRRSTGL